MKQLATTTATQNIQLVSEIFEYSTDQCIGQDDFLSVEEPLYDDANFENISDCESNDSFGALDNLSDFEEGSNANGDSENVQLPSERGLYFPFPSEIFSCSIATYITFPDQRYCLYLFVQRNESNSPANTQNTGLNV